MPSPLNLPDIRPGQPMLASDMQKIVAAVRRQTLQPGQFQSGAFTVTRPIHRSVETPSPLTEVEFQILTSVDAATWDDEADQLTPQNFRARLFVPSRHTEGDDEGELNGKFRPQADEEDEPVYVRGVSYLPDAVSVTEGYFRVGIGVQVTGSPWNSPPFYVEGDFDEEDWETFPVTIKLFNVSCSERSLPE